MAASPPSALQRPPLSALPPFDSLAAALHCLASPVMFNSASARTTARKEGKTYELLLLRKMISADGQFGASLCFDLVVWLGFMGEGGEDAYGGVGGHSEAKALMICIEVLSRSRAQDMALRSYLLRGNGVLP